MRKVLALVTLVALGGPASAADLLLKPREVALEPPVVTAVGFDTIWVTRESFDTTAVASLPDGWLATDLTDLPTESHWHIDGRNTHGGTGAWWCGTETPQWTGYGNMWRQQLDLDIDLSAASGTVGLTYWQFVDCEWELPSPPFDTWDGGTARLSTDGGTTWSVIEPQEGYPDSAIYAFFLQDGEEDVPGWSGELIPEWEEVTFALSDYIGSEIIVRFDFASDAYNSNQDSAWVGFDSPWFIDDVKVANTDSDTYFQDGMEGAQRPEWTPRGAATPASGDWWSIVDDTHPQPDGRPVYNSIPHGLYVGDPESNRSDGSYFAPDHNLLPLDNAIEMPPFDLSGDLDMVSARIRWQERMSGDGEGANTLVDVSTDGGLQWAEIDRFDPNGASDWGERVVDLSNHIGEASVSLRFRAGTGTAESHYLYWYVDDIEVFYLKNASGIGDELPSASSGAVLHAASPNPFNPKTHISFTLTEESDVGLSVFDLRGRLVRTLARGRRPAGTHTLSFDGRDERGSALASGVYTVRLSSGGAERTTRLLMLK